MQCTFGREQHLGCRSQWAEYGQRRIIRSTSAVDEQTWKHDTIRPRSHHLDKMLYREGGGGDEGRGMERRQAAISPVLQPSAS